MEFNSDLLQKTDKEVGCSANFEGHSNSVDCVQFNPKNENNFISGSFDQTIMNWDVNQSKALNVIKGHQGGIWSLDFSSDGSFFASGSADNSIKLWDTKTLKEIGVLSGHKDHVYSVHITKDQSSLISTSEDGTVKIWDIKQKKNINSYETGASIIFSAKCDEAAKNVFVTDSNGILSVLDMKSGKEIAKTEGYPKTEIPPRFYNTSFDPQYANDIFVSANNGRFKRYSFIDNVLTLIHEEPAHLDQCKHVNLNRGIQKLATCCKDGTFKLWDTAKNKIICLYVGFNDASTCSSFPNVENPKIVAASSWDQTVKIFPLNF